VGLEINRAGELIGSLVLIVVVYINVNRQMNKKVEARMLIIGVGA
jgi:hypothetical protein